MSVPPAVHLDAVAQAFVESGMFFAVSVMVHVIAASSTAEDALLAWMFWPCFEFAVHVYAHDHKHGLPHRQSIGRLETERDALVGWIMAWSVGLCWVQIGIVWCLLVHTAARNQWIVGTELHRNYQIHHDVLDRRFGITSLLLDWVWEQL